jgi:hypothetical protein
MESFGDFLVTKNEQDEQTEFYCKKCDYTCCKKYNWERHLLASKHIKVTDCSKSKKNEQIISLNHKSVYSCDICQKIYESRNGLWKHKKKCLTFCENKKETNITPETETKIKESEAKELIQYLMKENSEFKQLIIEQNKQMIELSKNVGNNNNNNNNNNNSFNLSLYLNETCKDALNIMDFVKQLNVGTKDLEETGRLGFADGISKIFINGLKDLDFNNRPVHCSDSKRETLYIKDNNQWNKDDEDKTLLTNAIKHVAHKNMKQISEWTKENPEYNDYDSKQNDKYLKIVSEAMSGSTQEETNKNYNKIIKNIVKETIINK